MHTRIQDNGIQRYRNSQPEYSTAENLKFSDLQGYMDTMMQRYRDTGIQGYRDTGIQRY